MSSLLLMWMNTLYIIPMCMHTCIFLQWNAMYFMFFRMFFQTQCVSRIVAQRWKHADYLTLESVLMANGNEGKQSNANFSKYILTLVILQFWMLLNKYIFVENFFSLSWSSRRIKNKTDFTMQNCRFTLSWMCCKQAENVNTKSEILTNMK